MVRRWSYLNALNWIESKKLFKVKKKIKFRLFKLNVKFKRLRKLKLKRIKLKRRSFQYLKSSSKFIIFTKSFKFWAKDYQISQNLIKFEYVYNIFLMNYFLYDGSCINNKNEYIGYNVNFILAHCTRKSNFSILPISIIYLSKQIPNLFFIYSNKNARFAWSYENFVDLDESLYFPFFLNSDFTFFNTNNCLTDKQIDLSMIWHTLTFFIFYILFYYRNAFICYSNWLILT